LITLKALLKSGQVQLENYSDSAIEDCEILLSHTLNKNSAWLIAHSDSTLTSEQTLAFQTYLRRRSAGEPVAYIVGQRAFWEHQFEVNANVLIPRSESEMLVELAIQISGSQTPTLQTQTIADLGTGSGAIAISLAHELPQSKVIAVDVLPEALAVARRNAKKIGVANVRFIESNWFSKLGGQDFNIIVANPPYVALGDPHLVQGDLRFEPSDALCAGPNGIDDIQKIINQATEHLQPNGNLMIEHGFEQGSEVRKLLSNAGFNNIVTHRDIAGLERVSCGSLE
jgi:release factor glutamine methyltransferase